MRFAIFAAAMLYAPTALAQFALDLTFDEYNQRVGRFTVGQMAVGERGFTRSTFPFCTSDGQLFIPEREILNDGPSDHGLNVLIERLPSSRASVVLQQGSRASRPVSEDINRLVGALVVDVDGFRDCETSGRREHASDQRLVVVSINGFSSLAELMNSLD